MERRRISEDPADLKDLLGATEIIPVEGDSLEGEYLTLLWAHPGFQKARRELRDEFLELEDWGVFVDSSDQEAARKDTTTAAYPLRKFAEDWGVSPAAAYSLARTADADFGPDSENTHFIQFRRDASAVIVWEDDAGCTLRVPKPLTEPRKTAIRIWLKGKRKPGRLEKLWGLGDKSRWQVSSANVEALPWFKRWNEGEEPAAIWRDLKDENPRLVHRNFVDQLAEIVSRMRNISEDEIRPDRPSEKRA